MGCVKLNVISGNLGPRAHSGIFIFDGNAVQACPRRSAGVFESTDITTLGKTIGVGRRLGHMTRADIMVHVPAGSDYQAGTLSGNPLR
jgi:glutamate-1-semialdehyde aminotransferase